jgi:CRP/FNR family cyclic AMP-dependent transcriptional regulator
MDEQVRKQVEDFFGRFKKQSFRKGEILIRADDDPAGIYYIREGIVKKYAISHKGEELTVNIFKPHAFFPMSWALNSTPNTFFYEAATDVEVWRAPREDVVTFVKNEPEVLFDLMKRVYRGTDGMVVRMLYLMGGSAFKRLLTELLIHAKRFGTKDEKGVITCQISEKDLAAQAGMTRETVSREMKILKDRKLVTFANGVLRIEDISKLEAAVAEDA